MDHRRLPDSTGAVVRGHIDRTTAIAWARDCWQTGFETDGIKALAILEADESERVRTAMDDAIRELGLLEPDAADYWSERWLLSGFLAGVLSDLDVMSDGFQLWTAFRERSGEDAANPFDIYFALDLDAFEITEGDIHDLPVARRRPWIIRKLVEAGVFERAGLEPPTA